MKSVPVPTGFLNDGFEAFCSMLETVEWFEAEYSNETCSTVFKGPWGDDRIIVPDAELYNLSNQQLHRLQAATKRRPVRQIAT